MKKLLILTIILIATPLLAQNSTKKNTKTDTSKEEKQSARSNDEVAALIGQAREHKKLYKYIAKYIENEYVKKNEKKLPSLEKKIERLNKLIAVTNNPNTKKKYQEQLKELKAEVEVIKLWKIYHKLYVTYNEASDNGEDKKYFDAMVILGKIHKRYSELKAQEFPDIDREFYKKYGAQIKKAKSNKQ